MRNRRRTIPYALGLLAAVLAALLPTVLGVAVPDDSYLLDVYIWILFYAQCACAWNLIGGFAGQYSFGHAAFLGIGAYTSTLLYLNLGLTPWIGMFGGGIVAAAVAALVAFPCFRLRGAFFSLVTIAFAEMLRVSTELTDQVFGIQINDVRGLMIPPKGEAPASFQFLDKTHYVYVILAMLTVTLLIGAAVKRSRFGYYLAAISEDEEALASLGTNPRRVKLLALLLSAFLTAIAGTFYAQFVLFITPTRIMGLDLSLQMVTMSVLGGLGTVLGPVYGALILVPLQEISRAVWGGSAQGLYLVIYGILLMAVVRYAPSGIGGAVDACIAAVRSRVASRSALHPADPAGRQMVDVPAGHLIPIDDPTRRSASLTLDGVSRRFGGAVGVRDLSFSVAAGEVVGLIGPNGAGKTTVLNLITGALAPQAGRIRFADQDLRGMSPDAINRLGIARTFQIVRPFTKLTVLENVLVAALPRHLSQHLAREEAERCLSFVGLGHRLGFPASGLSTGERKRLELARALATRPRLLLMDEVTGGLDQASIPGLIALIRRIRDEGISLLVIEHNLHVINQVADRLVLLNLGQKMQEGPPAQVLHDPRTVEIYVGGDEAALG